MKLIWFRLCCVMIGLAVAGAASCRDASKRDVVGYFWVPEHDSSPYWTLADHRDGISTLAPTWLSFNAAGQLTDNSDRRLVAWAHKNGIRVTPLVANSPFKPETARQVFETDDAIRMNVARLLKSVQDAGADGLNVDIEAVDPADRPRYNAFIEALCKAFHGADLIVTAALPAKTSDTRTGAWAGFADYAFLARHLDQLQLMCYDEHWSSGEAGPIASIPWVRKVLEYAVTVVPREKLVLGVPFYGYDWPPEGAASEMTARRSKELLTQMAITPSWDDAARSHHFTYRDTQGRQHTVYYEDARSQAERIRLAREFRLAGVAIWRLGDETDDFWPPLVKYRIGK